MYFDQQAIGSHKYDKKEIVKHNLGISDPNLNLHGGLLMSDYMEIINPQLMVGRLYFQGEVVEEYKIAQCDKCSQLRKLDHFGYQKGYDKQDNIIWFCGDCR
jgi:hypothetical protein